MFLPNVGLLSKDYMALYPITSDSVVAKAEDYGSADSKTPHYSHPSK
jgi:hypothetical protein